MAGSHPADLSTGDFEYGYFRNVWKNKCVPSPPAFRWSQPPDFDDPWQILLHINEINSILLRFHTLHAWSDCEFVRLQEDQYHK